jgi:hypothetical protein
LRGTTVTVVNPIHPLNGQELTVMYAQRLSGIRVVFARHPNGGTIVLPEGTLDIAPTPRPRRGFSDDPLPLFEPARLLELVVRVAEIGRTSRHDMK